MISVWMWGVISMGVYVCVHTGELSSSDLINGSNLYVHVWRGHSTCVCPLILEWLQMFNHMKIYMFASIQPHYLHVPGHQITTCGDEGMVTGHWQIITIGYRACGTSSAPRSCSQVLLYPAQQGDSFN